MISGWVGWGGIRRVLNWEGEMQKGVVEMRKSRGRNEQNSKQNSGKKWKKGENRTEFQAL